jgi:hypothetical protein
MMEMANNPAAYPADEIVRNGLPRKLKYGGWQECVSQQHVFDLSKYLMMSLSGHICKQLAVITKNDSLLTGKQLER